MSQGLLSNIIDLIILSYIKSMSNKDVYGAVQTCCLDDIYNCSYVRISLAYINV